MEYQFGTCRSPCNKPVMHQPALSNLVTTDRENVGDMHVARDDVNDAGSHDVSKKNSEKLDPCPRKKLCVEIIGNVSQKVKKKKKISVISVE